jgi:2-polyprenyl-3-methyl-5-hydroxy-6-metoxy-1,4-benzoquinol methylase
MQRYKFFAPLCKGKRVLDVACGVGYGSAILANGGAAHVYGVDIAHEAVAYAQAHYSQSAGRFLVSDCTRPGLHPQQFDVVISFETIEHVAEPEKFVQAVYDLLAEGGIFVCSTPNILRASLAGMDNEYHLSEMAFADFYALMARYFTIERAYHQSETLQGRILQWLKPGVRKLFRHLVRPVHAQAFNWILYPTPGDFRIIPLAQPSARHKIYILVGHK